MPKAARTSTSISGMAAGSGPWGSGVMDSVRYVNRGTESRRSCVGRGSRPLRGQPRRAQHAIGLDNPLQPLLGAPVAAICVGMKPLHKFLIPRLYLVQARVVL